MQQPSDRHTPGRHKSPAWVISVAVFLVIYLILQQQQRGKQPEVPGSNHSVSVATDGSDQDLQPTKIDAELLPQTASDRELPESPTTSSGKAAAPARKTVRTPASSNRPPPGSSSDSKESRPELGQLQKSGNQVWESTAGLTYGPGSQEKHRLKHVMRHATDQPRRPGKHGVFAGEGEQAKVLALIDEAYLKALQGGRTVQKKQDGQRTVYTVDMQRPVGYVGGQVGNRMGKPPANKIRLVLEGSSVITAFPM